MFLLDRQSVIVDMNVKPTPCTQGHIAQWLEHPVYNQEVLGSNPSLVIFLCGPTLSPLGHVSPLGCFPIGLLRSHEFNIQWLCNVCESFDEGVIKIEES